MVVVVVVVVVVIVVVVVVMRMLIVAEEDVKEGVTTKKFYSLFVCLCETRLRGSNNLKKGRRNSTGGQCVIMEGVRQGMEEINKEGKKREEK